MCVYGWLRCIHLLPFVSCHLFNVELSRRALAYGGVATSNMADMLTTQKLCWSVCHIGVKETETLFCLSFLLSFLKCRFQTINKMTCHAVQVEVEFKSIPKSQFNLSLSQVFCKQIASPEDSDLSLTQVKSYDSSPPNLLDWRKVYATETLCTWPWHALDSESVVLKCSLVVMHH